jgi:hypothetical protein
MRKRVIRSRMTFANLTSLVALFVALGGSSYAALALPKDSVGLRQLKRNAVTSKKVKDRSLRAVDFARGQLPRGERGPAGAQGAAGPQGATGPTGPAGPITGTLPSGVTLRGVYGIAARSAATAVQAPISFGLALPSEPTRHYVPFGGTPPPECPGEVNTPQALPGHLCVYGRSSTGTTSVLIDSPADGGIRLGAIVQANTAGSVDVIVKGTWAVTAP